MYKLLIISFTLCLFISCGDNPENIFRYNKNPQYTHGEVVFYGAYYSDYGNYNYVSSLSLLSDSLKIDNYGYFRGIGQNLCITDIFTDYTHHSPFLHDGTYTASDSGEPFTFYKGEVLTIDSVDYTLGAYIYFIEKISQLSKIQLIDRGSFTVSTNAIGEKGPIQTIICDFILKDSSKLAGTFSAELPYYDQSIGVLPINRYKKLAIKQR